MASEPKGYRLLHLSDLHFGALSREARTPPTKFEKVIAVLTSKPLGHIVREGGTGPWTLNRKHAREHRFAVCIHKTGDHGTAFVVGRIKEVVTSPENPDRWLITFSEYAPITVPEAWRGWRNPVRYTDLQELGIDPASLVFMAMPSTSAPASKSLSPQEASNLTIEEAKMGLAKTFGVPVDSIEITIKL